MVVMQRQLDRSVRGVLRRLLGWIAAGMGLLCALLFAISWQQQASLRTVFDDRVQPLHQLQRIGHALNVNLPAELDSPVVDSGVLQRQTERVAGIWQVYLTTYLTDEEKLLAQRTGQRLETALAAARGGDRAAYERALHGFNAAIGPLAELQVRVAEEEMRQAQQRAGWAQGLALLCLLAGLLLLLRVWQLLQAEVVWPVRVVADALANLSDGGGELGPEARSLSGDFAEVGEHLRQLQVVIGERLSRPPPA
jgi:hypothetical protein